MSIIFALLFSITSSWEEGGKFLEVHFADKLVLRYEQPACDGCLSNQVALADEMKSLRPNQFKEISSLDSILNALKSKSWLTIDHNDPIMVSQKIIPIEESSIIQRDICPLGIVDYSLFLDVEKLKRGMVKIEYVACHYPAYSEIFRRL